MAAHFGAANGENMNAIVRTDEMQQQTTVVLTPLDTIRIKITECTDLALLKELKEIETAWHKEMAERAYIKAFANFKKNMPDVVKDMLNKQYGSDYSSLANLVNTTNKVLGEYGLNARWDIDQSNGIRAICILKHFDGHSETVSISGPPDNSGQKNAWQQIKSALTYAEGATFQAITGVVARSASVDDDGNGTGPKAPEIERPADVDNWIADARAIADEGSERLQDLWKKTPTDIRRFIVTHEEMLWKETKAKAAKVDAKAKEAAK
jgi:hypothetical protein